MTIPTQPDDERRASTRRDLKLEVEVSGRTPAVTENVSSTGVLLRLPDDADVGSEFVMDIQMPAIMGGVGGRVRFRAEVVRVEEADGGRSVAARFTDWEVVE